MGKLFDHIPEKYIEWIRKQEVFWMATAPLAKEGHINVSPKGLRGTFFVENGNKVWYEDLTGSGCETIAHIRENERVTILFNALEGPAEIVRLYGKGSVHEFGSKEYEAYLPSPKRKPGSRAVIVVDVDRVSTSCGFGVPRYKFEGHRQTLYSWAGQLEKNENSGYDVGDSGKSGNGYSGMTITMSDYWKKKSLFSIDGLPALKSETTATGLPLRSTLPEGEEAAFWTRSSGSGNNQVEKRGGGGDTGKGVISEGNLKIIYGLILGFGLSFVISDLKEGLKKYIIG